MPIVSLRLVPGLNTERTPSLNEAGFSETSSIRWRDGLPEKLKGWQWYFPRSIGSKIYSLNAWTSLNNDDYLGVGAANSLNIISSGVLSDLTPQVYTSDIAPDFSTTSGSATITIVDTNISNVTTYDTISLDTPIIVGGLILFGSYVIQSIVTATSYTITAASNATATVVSGGAVPAFTVTASSYSVSVNITGHGLSVGDTLNFPVSTTVGGITISGNYSVQSVTDADNFVITAANSATTSAGPTSMNSGNAEIVYNIGQPAPSGGSGWGTGGWGTGGWGNSTGSAPQSGTSITATDWTLANWGEDLIASPRGGTIYYWPPESGFQTVMPIPNAPPACNGIMIAMPQQILVAWGASANLSLGTSQDPLLVAWTTPGDFTVWTAATGNLAGTKRLPRGSAIIGGFQSSFRTLLFTDVECYSMDYIGYPLVFSFNKVGTNCGLIGRAAVAELGGTVFWMGPAGFFALTGSGLKPLRCPVWDAIFQDLDAANASKVVAGANSDGTEMWWWWPSTSGGTGENDKYVKYNILENAWDTGSMARSAWLDRSILGAPIAAGIDQYLHQHETTYNANGVAISSSFTTGYFALSEGQDIAFVDWFLPDMRFGPYGGTQNANVQFTFNTLMYTGDTPTTHGPYTVTSTTQYVPLRFRARFISMTLLTSDLGTFWRLGRPRLRWVPDGRR